MNAILASILLVAALGAAIIMAVGYVLVHFLGSKIVLGAVIFLLLVAGVSFVLLSQIGPGDVP